MDGALERACSEAGAGLRQELRPGDIGEIVRMHGELYAEEHGFSVGFEAYVAGTFAPYPWPLAGRERLWIVETDGRIAGTIAIVRGSDNAAQLRWLLLRADLRGKGLGRAMVAEAVAFSRLCGYSSVFLWTVSSLSAATSVYRRAGFERTRTKTHELWGAVRTEERYDLSLA
jgi:GNAT superfamily N-acetyltransferase